MNIVKEKFKNIPESFLAELAAESEYWGRAEKFWMEVKDRDYDTLEFKQKNWLLKIAEDIQREL